MSLALHLENFDNGAAPGGFSQIIDEPAAGYEKGYEDGLAAGQWEAQQLQSQLRADLVQTISDQALTIEAAQELLLCAITPLFDDVLDTLLPQVLSPAFFTALQQIIGDACASHTAGALTLTVAPDQVGPIQDAVAEITQNQIVIKADAALTHHAAWVATPDTEIAVDLDAARAAIKAHLADLCAAPAEVADHG